MKHAGNQALDTLEDVLAKIREQPGLKEKKRGVFYLKSSAFLHFHEDKLGMFADVRTSNGWMRYPITRSEHRVSFLHEIERLIARGDEGGLEDSGVENSARARGGD